MTLTDSDAQIVKRFASTFLSILIGIQGALMPHSSL